ncbi:MAG TPA: glutamyl-tRNA reductase, partial [Actinomycetota bacterium]|nr:glutamyl-tRNA reductase [Actinomycetota bacterium]
MSLLLVGINHKTAPVALLEKLAIAQADLTKALHQLASYEHVLEGVILSTCNRVEVYADVSRFHGGSLDLRNFLAEFRHLAPEDFVDHLYTYHDDAALRHLFRVASGIDSMVIGESGAGKSMTGAAVIGLIEPPGRIAGGEIRLRGRRIDDLPPEA